MIGSRSRSGSVDHDLLAGAGDDDLRLRVLQRRAGRGGGVEHGGEALRRLQQLEHAGHALAHLLERETPSARHIRRSVPNWLISTGMREPRTLRNSSAGPPAFIVRSAISVISRCGSTSAVISASSPSAPEQLDPVAQVVHRGPGRTPAASAATALSQARGVVRQARATAGRRRSRSARRASARRAARRRGRSRPGRRRRGSRRAGSPVRGRRRRTAGWRRGARGSPRRWSRRPSAKRPSTRGP